MKHILKELLMKVSVVDTWLLILRSRVHIQHKEKIEEKKIYFEMKQFLKETVNDDVHGCHVTTYVDIEGLHLPWIKNSGEEKSISKWSIF